MVFLPCGTTAYGRLLRLPRARQAVAGSSVCRLSYGMLVLALLLVVDHATRSFAIAGAASAAFSLSTLSGPAKARWIGDRPRRWGIASLGAVYVSSLVGLALLASAGVDRPPPFLVLSATTGLATPPVGAMMRAHWASITTPADRPRAFALDVALEDSLFFIGPLLTGGLVALGGPGLALWVAAALFAIGVNLLILVPRPGVAGPDAGLERGPGRPRKGVLHPLSSAGVRAVLVVLLGISAGTGVIEVAVAARAVHHADAAAAGYVLAAGALGSVVGGLIWGHLAHRLSAARQLIALGGLVVATLAASATARSLVVLAAILAVDGAALSPLLVLVYLVVDRHAGGGHRTLVSSWANTVFNAGAALGAAAGGAVVTAFGSAPAFLAGAGVAAAGVTLAVLARQLVVLEHVQEQPGQAPAG